MMVCVEGCRGVVMNDGLCTGVYHSVVPSDGLCVEVFQGVVMNDKSLHQGLS